MNYKIKTILILEDEPDILETIKIFLELEGFIVSTARNGLEALEFLENINSPDLIILDMKMPLMDGWEFAKAYRDRYGSETPFFVMTAAADAKRRAMDVGAVDWLEKPFDLDDMLEKIANFENVTSSNLPDGFLGEQI